MLREEALRLLGLEPGVTAAEVEAAWKRKHDEATAQLQTASREKRKELNELIDKLEDARDALKPAPKTATFTPAGRQLEQCQ